METGRVRGTLVLNKTLPAIEGKKIRIMEEIDLRDIGREGNMIVTFDYIGVGEGEIVLYEGGPESAMAYYPDMTGSDTNILAIVDDITM